MLVRPPCLEGEGPEAAEPAQAADSWGPSSWQKHPTPSQKVLYLEREGEGQLNQPYTVRPSYIRIHIISLTFERSEEDNVSPPNVSPRCTTAHRGACVRAGRRPGGGRGRLTNRRVVSGDGKEKHPLTTPSHVDTMSHPGLLVFHLQAWSAFTQLHHDADLSHEIG